MPIKRFESLALSVSNKKIPCLWENGGKLTEDFGQSFIIADKYADTKKPLYIRTESKPNSGHALIPVKIRDIVVVYRIKSVTINDISSEITTIQIYSISRIDLDSKLAYVDIINSFEDGEWTYAYNDIYDRVIAAAKLKASTVDCIEVVYAADRNTVVEETAPEQIKEDNSISDSHISMEGKLITEIVEPSMKYDDVQEK